MSAGGILGAVVGGIIGWFIGGPAGILYGASLGFGLGMMVDPLTPDLPTPGAPLPMAAEVMSTTIGDPLPDLVGTSKITGHLLCFGKERTKTIYTEVEGAKGGEEPEPYATGYEYYMSWAVGVAAGPVDTIYAIYKGDIVVWEGELHIPTDPDSYGQETITLVGEGPPVVEEEESFLNPIPDLDPTEPSMGSATFYFGTNNQVANSSLGDIIGDATLNSPYRNFCWCFFDDCYIGAFNRCPTMKFIVRKAPDIAFSGSNEIQIYDYNPMHAIWYILHDLSGLPETWLDTADFAAVASVLAGENRGISCLFLDQQNTLNYLGTINNHIDCIIRYGSDGKFHPKLIRDDYTVGDLSLIDESVMLDDPTFERKSWIDTVNEVKVQYTEIARSYSFPQGLWKAAMSPPDTPDIYLYDVTYKSVIKVYTGDMPPMCTDTLIITEGQLDYDMGYGNPGAQRGGYCMNKDGTRLWYLVRVGLNCELIEVDITKYSASIVKTTVFPSLMFTDEKISDGCSDDTYTYWCTTLVAGRVIKIRNSDHILILDTTFDYPIIGSGDSGDSCIESIDVGDNKLFWIYSRSHMDDIPQYNVCSHWVRSDLDLGQEIDQIYCGTGGNSPYWQNLVRYYSPYVLIHRAYHVFCGALYDTDKNLGYGSNSCEYYMQNILGVDGDQIFMLNYSTPYITYLKCSNLPGLNKFKEIDVSQYTGHLYNDGKTWSSTSAMSNYAPGQVLTLFTYDETNSVNIATCFRADPFLPILCTGDVNSGGQIIYGN